MKSQNIELSNFKTLEVIFILDYLAVKENQNRALYLSSVGLAVLCRECALELNSYVLLLMCC